MTESTGLSRRSLLGAAGAGVAGVALGAAGAAGIDAALTPPAPVRTPHWPTIDPHDVRQMGITTPMMPVTELVAFTLLPGTTKESLGRLFRLWSRDIDNLAVGRPIPGDITPELAQPNIGLTVTVGVGPAVFDLPGLEDKRPPGFVEIPPMVHDRLDPRWSGGDLVVVVSAADPTSVDYASHALIRDAETFASPRWIQRGEWRPTDGNDQRVTGRNLFGQVDGTANPQRQALGETLWAAGAPAWLSGGTQMVVRRIEMDLPEWEKLTRHEQERAMGRDLATGAPLTGGDEAAAPDFDAVDDQGQPVIAADAHVRLSHPLHNGGRQILRRAMNYAHTEFVDGGLKRTHGLVFVAYCGNLEEQFVPIQTSLDAGDALNKWTTAIGSAVFVVLPGYHEDTWLGQSLLEG